LNLSSASFFLAMAREVCFFMVASVFLRMSASLAFYAASEATSFALAAFSADIFFFLAAAAASAFRLALAETSIVAFNFF
jgi:hypothetical protein